MRRQPLRLTHCKSIDDTHGLGMGDRVIQAPACMLHEPAGRNPFAMVGGSGLAKQGGLDKPQRSSA